MEDLPLPQAFLVDVGECVGLNVSHAFFRRPKRCHDDHNELAKKHIILQCQNFDTEKTLEIGNYVL